MRPDSSEKVQPQEKPPPSLLSPYEIDSARKSSPPVLERRKHLTKIVAGTVGVAWFICIVAMSETALRAMFFH